MALQPIYGRAIVPALQYGNAAPVCMVSPKPFAAFSLHDRVENNCVWTGTTSSVTCTCTGGSSFSGIVEMFSVAIRSPRLPNMDFTFSSNLTTNVGGSVTMVPGSASSDLDLSSATAQLAIPYYRFRVVFVCGAGIATTGDWIKFDFAYAV